MKYLNENCRLAEKVELINPKIILAENYKPEKKNIILNGKLLKIKAYNSVFWAAEYFKKSDDILKNILKNIDDNFSLKENCQGNAELKNFLCDNPMISEAAYKLEGIITDILPDFENVLLRSETTPSIYFAGAVLFSQMDLIENCAEILKRPINEYPGLRKKIDTLKILNNGIKLYDNDEFHEAIEILNEISSHKEFGNSANFYIANSYFFLNKYSDAEYCYKKIILENLEPEQKYWYNYFRAIIDYKYRKNTDSAINYLEQAISISSLKSNAFHYLGLIYNDIKNYGLAKKYLGMFIERARSKDADKIERVKKILSKIEIIQETNS